MATLYVGNLPRSGFPESELRDLIEWQVGRVRSIRLLDPEKTYCFVDLVNREDMDNAPQRLRFRGRKLRLAPEIPRIRRIPANPATQDEAAAPG